MINFRHNTCTVLLYYGLVKGCPYHYAQVEPIIETDVIMRPFQFYHVLGFKSGIIIFIDIHVLLENLRIAL